MLYLKKAILEFDYANHDLLKIIIKDDKRHVRKLIYKEKIFENNSE